ncbi:MAG: hypothetical protein VCC04_05570, partial [Myxococcota bacterium]
MSLLFRLHGFLKGRERTFAQVIAVVVVLVCWAVIFQAGDAVKSMDEPDFLAIAENLAFSGVFAVEPDAPTAYRAPGLAFFMVPFVRFGAGLMEVRLANAVLV